MQTPVTQPTIRLAVLFRILLTYCTGFECGCVAWICGGCGPAGLLLHNNEMSRTLAGIGYLVMLLKSFRAFVPTNLDQTKYINHLGTA